MILIVDDDPALAEICAMMLESYGYEAMIATSGRDAIAHMGVQKIDLLIADCVMPDMDGLELSRVVKLAEHTRATPIVLMSGSLQSDVAVGNTYEVFLRKPFLAEHLLAQVERLLPNHVPSNSEQLLTA